MSTENQSNPPTALAISRGEKLQIIRDEMTPGARPNAIVPRTFAEVQAMCVALASAGLAPKSMRDKPLDMAIVIMNGAELGIPPMASLRLFTTWDGVPRLMAEGVRAVILTHPEIEYFEPQSCSDTQATWIGKRRGRPEKSATWTIERAKRAGLTGKPVWQAYPEDMLNARASMQLGRMIAADLIAGMVSLEEARDGDFIDAYSEPKAAQFVAPPVGRTPIDTPELRFAIAQVANTPAEPIRPAGGGPGEQARRGPGRPPKAQPENPPTGASAPSPNFASSPTSTAPTSSLPASPPTSSAAEPSKLDSAIRAVEEKKADPTPASSSMGPTPSAESPAVSTAPTTSGAAEGAPAASDGWFGGEDPVDAIAAGKPKLRTPAIDSMSFYDWLASCKTQRDLQAGLQKWRAWSQDQAKAGDTSFNKDGASTIEMQTAYSTRKSEVPA